MQRRIIGWAVLALLIGGCSLLAGAAPGPSAADVADVVQADEMGEVCTVAVIDSEEEPFSVRGPVWVDNRTILFTSQPHGWSPVHPTMWRLDLRTGEHRILFAPEKAEEGCWLLRTPLPPRSRGRIYFACWTNPDREHPDMGTWTCRADGTGARRIVGVGRIGKGQWATDRSRVIFTRYERRRHLGLWSCRGDGRGLRQICDDLAVDFSLSPDGEHVAYTLYEHENGKHDLWVVRVDGSDKGLVAEDAWSPSWLDASSILYVGDPQPDLWFTSTSHGGGSAVRRMSLEGKETQNILKAPEGAVITYVQAAPDGSKIWFSTWSRTKRPPRDEHVIWLASPDGSLVRCLAKTREEGSPGGPAWSPDSTRLIWSRRSTFEMVGPKDDP